MFSPESGQDLTPNVLSMCLQPDEGAHLQFQAKVPDQGMSMRPVDMDFHCETAFSSQTIPEAYERLLQDALEGEAARFIRSDPIEEVWCIVDPLLRGWEASGTAPPHVYEPDSRSPEAAEAFLAQDGRSWLHVWGGH